MPRAFRCAGSVRRPLVAVDERTSEGEIGTAVHEALRPMVDGLGVPLDALASTADRYDVDADELRMLVSMGAKLWDKVSDSFAEARSEVALSAEVAPGVVLTGHTDLLSITDRVARLGDWKTGRKDSDYSHQVRAYAALAAIEFPEVEEITGTILWIREQEIENYTLTRAEALAWIARVRAEIVDWDGVHHPGTHCGYCPRSHECEAMNAMVRRDVALISDEAIGEAIATMDRARVVELYQRAAMVERCADRVRKAVRARVEAEGPIDDGSTVISIVDEERRALNPLAAWPVLESSGFRDEDFAACIDLRVSRVEKRVAEKAGRGKGAGAIRALNEQLEAANAVGKSVVSKISVKRKAG